MTGATINVLDSIPHLRRVALVMVGDRERGDALVEEGLRRGLASFEPGISGPALSVALFRAMWSAMVSDYARHAAGDGPDGPVPRTGGPVDSSAIERGLAMMPPELRMTLVLVVMEGMSYEDAAAVTDVSVATLRTRLRQAREILYQAGLSPQHGPRNDREGSPDHVPSH
jgi:RNA polymerase sigma-70 factor (ECF subfamily)